MTTGRRAITLTPMETGLVAAQGYAAEVASVRAANARPDPASGVVPTDTAALLDAYTAHGTAADVRAQVAGWDDAADIVSVGLLPGLPWELLEATIRACAPAHSTAGNGRAGRGTL